MGKKILEIGGYPPPFSGWNMRIYYLRKEMIKQGHICQVLNIGQNRKTKSPEFISTYNGADYLIKLLIKCIQGFRIHGHMNGDSPKGMLLTFLGLFFSLIFGKRPYLTFHAGTIQKYFPASKSKKFYWVFKIIFLLPQKIICNSEEVKRSILTYNINPQKIIPLPGFTKQYLKYNMVSLKPEINKFFLIKKSVIVAYGFMRPEFYWEQAIHAFVEVRKKLPDIGFLIIGLDRDDIILNRLFAKYKIRDSILLVENLDHNEFLTILSKASLYLRTPIKDGVASSVLEALSLGVPVVAADNGFRPPSTVVYDNKDFEGMVTSLLDVIQNNMQYRKRIIKPEIKDTLQEEINLLTTS